MAHSHRSGRARYELGRDVLLLVLGAAGVTRELFFVDLQPAALAIFASMMGFPGASDRIVSRVALTFNWLRPR